MASEVADLFVVLRAETKPFVTGMRQAGEEGDSFTKRMGGVGGILRKVALGGAAVGVAIGVDAVKAAMNFQQVTTRLVTSAGETASNLGLVRSGLLSMSGQVGVSATDLAQAMYYVEAAGYHAGDGLTVLKAAAQGAAAEGADTTTVAQALTDVLKDYHEPASAAADVTSKMITAVAHGKVSLQDFSASFASIVPAASAAGISFDDVGGALSEMTNHGFTAQRASQNLAQALRSMLNPTHTMADAYQQFGGSLDVLKAKLSGPDGLTNGMQYASQIAEHAGKVGTSSYAAALKLLMGTAAGANAALATTGENTADTSATIKAMGSASADAQGRVQGFALIQQNLSFQLKALREGFDAVLIRIGMGLIPALSNLIKLVEGRATPVLRGLGSAVSGIMSGFTGAATKPHAVAHLGNAGENRDAMSDAAAASTTPLTQWQQLGQTLKGIAQDLSTFVGQVAKSFGQLAQAAGPTLALFGGAALGALKAVATILKTVLGPALVAVTGFMKQHKDAIALLISVALAPLALRLGALAIIKPIGAIAKLGADIVKFPFQQVQQLRSTVSSAIGSVRTAGDTLKGVWGGLRFGAITVKDLAVSGWDKIANGASSVAGKISDLASAGWDKLSAAKSTVADLASAGWSKIVSGMRAVGSAMKAAALGALEFSRNTLTAMISAGRAAIAFLAEKASLIATAIAEKAAAAAEWLLNVALDANPIMLIVIAIAALVAAVIYAYNHFTWFREGVQEAFKIIGDAVSWVINFVKAHWPLLLAIITGPIGIAVLLITRYWTQIKNGFAAAWRFVVTSGEAAANWLRALPGRILGWFSSAGSWLLNAGKSIIQGLWNGMVSMGSWIAGQIMGLIKSVVPGPVLKILGINSPSRVFHEIGVNVTKGLVNGITSGHQQAANASAQLAKSVVAGAGRPQIGLGVTAVASSGSGANLPPIIVQVDGKKFFEIIQVQATRYNRRNPTNGLTVTNR